MDRPKYEADKYHIEIYDRLSRSITKVVDSWDRSVNSMQWTQDGSALICTAEDDGMVKLWKVYPVAQRVIPLLYTDGSVSTFSLIPGSDDIIVSKSSYISPPDLWKFSLRIDSAEGLKQITKVNPNVTHEIMSTPEKFYFEGANNDQVQGWIFKPLNWKPGKKYPLIHLIHGGPQQSFVDQWNPSSWNPQIYTSKGILKKLPYLTIPRLCSCDYQLSWFHWFWSKLYRFYQWKLGKLSIH